MIRQPSGRIGIVERRLVSHAGFQGQIVTNTGFAKMGDQCFPNRTVTETRGDWTLAEYGAVAFHRYIQAVLLPRSIAELAVPEGAAIVPSPEMQVNASEIA